MVLSLKWMHMLVNMRHMTIDTNQIALKIAKESVELLLTAEQTNAHHKQSDLRRKSSKYINRRTAMMIRFKISMRSDCANFNIILLYKHKLAVHKLT